jgi:sulfate permease, SulP family
MAWLFPSLRRYRSAWLRGDLIAGLTVRAVLIPESLAYASIAGVSPVVGLYAAPGRARALRGVRQLTAPRRRPDVGDRGAAVRDRRGPRLPQRPRLRRLHRGAGAGHRDRRPGGGLLRLGFLANFISEPVLKGFIIGLALILVHEVGQVRDVLRAVVGHDAAMQSVYPTVAEAVAAVGAP